MRRGITIFSAAIAIVMTVATATEAANAPSTWDGLVQVPSKKIQLVYLQPGADFRGYTKVIIDPTEVAFAKDWQRNYNRSALSPGSRVSDSDMQDAIRDGVKAASDIFADAWTKGGYAVVQEPGADVMQVKTGIMDIEVTAPEVSFAGRSHSFASEAGRATFFVEARDSTTGALLGRAIDRRLIGDNMANLRTSVSNRGDFRAQVKRWADLSVQGMNELKALSPVKQ